MNVEAPYAQIGDDDLLWQQLKSLPAHRALLGAVTARFLRAIPLSEPTLAIGCGASTFAHNIIVIPPTVGVDHNFTAPSTTHRLTTTADNSDLPFATAHFASIFSQSLPESHDGLISFLAETNRVLQENGRFVFTCPSHAFVESASTPTQWAERLAEAGFVVERWQYFISEQAAQALSLGRFLSFPSHILHALTGHWIVAPWESSLRPTERWLRPYYNEPFPAQGAYLLFVARKTSSPPQNVQLIPPQPFTHEALQPVVALPIVAPEATVVAPSPPITEQPQPPIPQAPPTPPKNRRPLLAAGFILAALLFALIGQSILRTDPGMPRAGLSWFAFSGLALLLFIGQRRSAKRGNRNWQLPRWQAIPRRRWFYLLALFCGVIAQRLVSASEAQRPLPAILLWLVAIALAFYALNNPLVANDRPRWHISRPTVLITLLLFIAALLIRLFQIGEHPFILNGIEADIGLNALAVARGFNRNPFGSAWLTNPTLPLYLLAVPLKLLGPSTSALRLLSAFIGALTVSATFLIGQRLWGRAVGLAGAILLLGSHFHLHYSRLGITNVWDGLLVLLALGLLGIAWQQRAITKRITWLAAGLAIGLNAYLFTSSRLLPLILLVLLLLSLLFEREKLRQQWRHGLAAALLALVVALPQLLYYRTNPGLFMERANLLGILDAQSGWLTAEAARLDVGSSTVWWSQFWEAALAFNATLDKSTAYGPPGPLLGFMVGILFVLGLLMTLFRFRQLRYNLLSVWVLATVILGGALLQNPPASHRLIIAAPALSLLSALALVQIVAVFVAAFGKEDDDGAATAVALPSHLITLSKNGLIIVVALTMLLAMQDIATYFGPYRSQHRFGDRNTEVANDMANYLNSLEGDWIAYFYGPPTMYVGFSTIPFLVTNFEKDVNLFDVEDLGAQPEVRNDAQTVHIYLPERQDELAAVQARYPQGTLRTFEGYYATPLFFVYEVRE